jgi:hypothetical protein
VGIQTPYLKNPEPLEIQNKFVSGFHKVFYHSNTGKIVLFFNGSTSLYHFIYKKFVFLDEMVQPCALLNIKN